MLQCVHSTCQNTRINTKPNVWILSSAFFVLRIDSIRNGRWSWRWRWSNGNGTHTWANNRCLLLEMSKNHISFRKTVFFFSLARGTRIWSRRNYATIFPLYESSHTIYTHTHHSIFHCWYHFRRIFRAYAEVACGNSAESTNLFQYIFRSRTQSDGLNVSQSVETILIS